MSSGQLSAKIPFPQTTRIVNKRTGMHGVVVQAPGYMQAGFVPVQYDGGSQIEWPHETDLLFDVLPSYVESLDPLYRNLFLAMWMLNPNARPEWGFAYQSLYAYVQDKGYSLGQVREACEELVRQNIMERSGETAQFYRLTLSGESIMHAVAAIDRSTSTTTPPPFRPPQFMMPAGG